MKKMVIGILAHVDSGKTTLSESMLYVSGKVRKLGRVDHGDAFLDTYELEKSRGITIFSKQAVFELGDKSITLLDTPGHVDFSAEMERTLQVLDYAILVINGADGVQGHTRTLWSLLQKYQIPTFLFVNKMDQVGTDAEKLLLELKEKLDGVCIFFGENQKQDEFYDALAMCNEEAMEEYLEKGLIADDTIIQMIRRREVFPCYFGSALKLEGIEAFLNGISCYTEEPEWTERFGAKVYKISRDSQNNRLTHMKITGGTLKVKDVLGRKQEGEVQWEEKVNQIRIYSGDKFEAVQEAGAGTVCAVTGLGQTYPGEGLGIEKDSEAPVLEPVLNYQILFPPSYDAHTILKDLRQLEEEEPMLRIVWKEELGEIHAQLMGEVQIEILQSLMKERFDVPISFGTGNIVYKETIQNTVEGVGHYEPLRHYAEVHLILEPGRRGSGLQFDTICSEDVLDRNWQRLILTHLMEKIHRGVLTGSAITDIKITLAAGRAHLKHTEGGDFRESTYRAVRQGLMQADSILLEPYYDFRLEVPAECVGRALTDIQKRYGEFKPPEVEGEDSVIVGSAPVATMRDYAREVASYSKGRGRLFCTLQGYAPCHNPEEVMEAYRYDPERDLENPTGSVFCAHGAGFTVPWNEVPEHMHIENQLEKLRVKENGTRNAEQSMARKPQISNLRKMEEADKELEEIFIRTYGRIERKTENGPKRFAAGTAEKAPKEQKPVKEYLLVDGYNVIHAWPDLKELAQMNFEAARNKLMDILCNYQGYKKIPVILVFDAYKVEGFQQEIQKYHNIHVVYTKEAETADQYIEKVVHEIGKRYHVTVVTSDGIEQIVTLGQGGTLISSREFLEEVNIVRRQIEEEINDRKETAKNYLFQHMDEDMAKEMEEVRLGKKEL